MRLDRLQESPLPLVDHFDALASESVSEANTSIVGWVGQQSARGGEPKRGLILVDIALDWRRSFLSRDRRCGHLARLLRSYGRRRDRCGS
jgi:hypothetical protein